MSRCKHCQQAAVADECCVRHALAAAIHRDNTDRAYAIAREHGWPPSAVRRLIRDRNEALGMALVSEVLGAA